MKLLFYMDIDCFAPISLICSLSLLEMHLPRMPLSIKTRHTLLYLSTLVGEYDVVVC